MKFVKSLGHLYMDAKEIPCVTGAGAPTASTLGSPGVLYMDTDTGALYKCTAEDRANGGFVWKPVTDVPEGGRPGQVLTRSEDGSMVWADPTGEVLEDVSEVAF